MREVVDSFAELAMRHSTPERWQQIQALFAEALEHEADERATLLDEACAADPDLRAELDRLLRAHGRSHGFLEELDTARAAALFAADDELDSGNATVGRYRVVRRLGRGGMGVIYLAHDERLDRPVALKLLPPWLGADESAGRRLVEEAKAASALDHPHIITVFEVGETADERLFLAMAYHEGETLRERIARGPLPMEAVVELAAQVAEGLAAAHRKGIIHRDIKPENLLITSDGVVKILDFGLAKVGSQVLTRSDATRGTVAYMSPEQTYGDVVDPSTDLWSLGVVLHEMLAGVRPFRRESDQALIHAIRHDAPEPLDAWRPGVPAALATIIRTCLAKQAVDRYGRAEDLLADLRSVMRAEPPRRGTRVFRRPSRGMAAAAAAALVLGVVAVTPHLVDRRTPGPALDPGVVAIPPFRTGGADPARAYLREGMLDLLAALFTGERGLRAVDARSLLSSWRREVEGEAQDLTPAAARRLAAGLGAGRLLLGEVASAPGQLALSASLLDVRTGNVLASATVSGPGDSLLVLVERLVVQLEARQAGEREERLDALSGIPLTAVRAYMAGREAYRRGDYQRAYGELEHALAIDSTFALAALALLEAYSFASGDALVARSAALAWSLADRLSARDRIMLEAIAGPTPVVAAGPPTWFTGHLLEARQRAVVALPDRPEAWLMLGDAFFHWGRLHGIDSWRERADASLSRALELDPTFTAPLYHLVELAVERGDTARIRKSRDLYLSHDSTGELAEFVRRRTALALEGTTLTRSRHESLEQVPLETLVRMLTAVRTDNVALDDAPHIESVLANVLARAGEGVVNAGITWGPLIFYMLDRGRSAEAVKYVERWPAGQATRGHVLHALYWDGDPDAANHAARKLAWQARTELEDDDPAARGLAALCVLEQWRIAHADTSTARRAIARLNATDYPGDRLCALMLSALLATAADARAREVAAQDLEAFLLRTGVLGGPAHEHANLVLARIHEARGDAQAALAAVRRRGRHPWGGYLSTYLREEGRLAARVGDVDGAARAYRHYLALRSDPEPRLRAEAAAVGRELARLERSRR